MNVFFIRRSPLIYVYWLAPGFARQLKSRQQGSWSFNQVLIYIINFIPLTIPVIEHFIVFMVNFIHFYPKWFYSLLVELPARSWWIGKVGSKWILFTSLSNTQLFLILEQIWKFSMVSIHKRLASNSLLKLPDPKFLYRCQFKTEGILIPLTCFTVTSCADTFQRVQMSNLKNTCKKLRVGLR